MKTKEVFTAENLTLHGEFTVERLNWTINDSFTVAKHIAQIKL